MEFERSLSISVLWFDSDMIELRIRAASDRFAGSCDVYVSHGTLGEFASALAGFPAGLKDERCYEFGTLDPQSVPGFCEFRFYCTNSAGHTALDITIHDNYTKHPKSSAKFIIPIEPAGVDNFVQGLKRLNHGRQGEAYLPMRYE